MAKKKELPKAMMGKIIKPVVRAVVSGAKAVKNTKSLKEGISAAKKTISKADDTATKTRSDWFNSNKSTTPKTATSDASKTAAKKQPMSKKKKAAIVGTGVAGVAAYKYANRRRRTLNDD